MRKILLTRAIVDAAQPEAAEYRIWDTKVPGLCLRVHPGGSRVYYVQWGRNRRRAIGKPPALTLDMARTKALAVLNDAAANGEVPQGYEALDRFAGLLMAAHMVTAYASWAFLGAGLLQSGAGPSWLGWAGVVTGSVLAVGYVALRGGPFAPPILAHVYTAVVGIGLLLHG